MTILYLSLLYLMNSTTVSDVCFSGIVSMALKLVHLSQSIYAVAVISEISMPHISVCQISVSQIGFKLAILGYQISV